MQNIFYVLTNALTLHIFASVRFNMKWNFSNIKFVPILQYEHVCKYNRKTKQKQVASNKSSLLLKISLNNTQTLQLN